MPQSRMRVFAGPNGSGKSTQLRAILAKENVPLEVYVNADDIEKELKDNKNGLLLSPFKIKILEEDIQHFFKDSTFSPKMRDEQDLWQKIQLEGDYLKVKSTIDSYLAADIAEFLRQQLLNQGLSFTYETVMSHPGKIGFMQTAKEKGYKVYLYFVSTLDPAINIYRVSKRASQNGHSVPESKITERFYKSLENLKHAVEVTNRSYIFDNSEDDLVLVAEINNNKEQNIKIISESPWWVETYLLS